MTIHTWPVIAKWYIIYHICNCSYWVIKSWLSGCLPPKMHYSQIVKFVIAKWYMTHHISYMIYNIWHMCIIVIWNHVCVKYKILNIRYKIVIWNHVRGREKGVAKVNLVLSAPDWHPSHLSRVGKFDPFQTKSNTNTQKKTKKAAWLTSSPLILAGKSSSTRCPL